MSGRFYSGEFGGHTLYLGARLLSERWVGNLPHDYDLAYTYDASGNRTKKIDLWNGKETTYWYDTDTTNLPIWIAEPNSRANRLLGYEVVDTTTSIVDLRVKYEYALDGPTAGNVTQIRRMTPDPQDPDPQNPSQFDVAGTCFAYNKLGELWIVTQRTWSEDANGLGTVTIQDIVEFRGSARSGGWSVTVIRLGRMYRCTTRPCGRSMMGKSPMATTRWTFPAARRRSFRVTTTT